ncbi:MAG: hypothetical protein ACD_79C01535G0004 [uncultured bacterium]|nr:MAG: hypothetical protein ACD_79C01535G0004 [uncultured bacterium]
MTLMLNLCLKMRIIKNSILNTINFDLLCFTYILIMNSFAHIRGLLNYYYCYPDVSLMYYYYKLFKDNLFPTDFFANYMFYSSNWLRISEGYLYLGKFVDFIYLIKVISFIFSITFFLFLYLLIKNIYNKKYSLFFLIFSFPLLLSMDSFYGAQPRFFGFLFSLIAFYGSLKGECKIILLCIIGALIFYPQIIPSLLVLYAIHVLFNWSDLKRKRKIVYIVIFISAFIGIFSLKSEENIYLFNNYGIYKKVSIESLTSIKLLLYNYIFNIDEHAVLYKVFIFIYLFFLIFIVCIFPRVFYNSFKKNFFFLFSHILSFIILFFMFEGAICSRQLIFSLPLVIIFMTSEITYNLYKNKLFNHTLIRIILFLIMVSSCFIIKFNNSFDYMNQKELFDYFSRLNNDIIIAGHPYTISMFPIFTQKQAVIVEPATAYMLSLDLLSKYQEIEDDLAKALTTSSPKRVANFEKKYCISHWVIDEELIMKGNSPEQPGVFINKIPIPSEIPYLIKSAKLNGIKIGRFLILEK